MNLLKRFFNWLFPKEPAYYYRMDEQTREPVKVPMDAPVVEEDLPVDVPLFTMEELKEMKKADLYELAINSGLTEVSPKDTKAALIRKISDHYEIAPQ